MTSPPPNPKVVVPIALLVCGAIAMGIYSSFPSRPPVRQPSLTPASSAGLPTPDAERDGETRR